MPSLPPDRGGLPPEAIPAPPTGSHLADTGHTIQSHWEQHQHIYDLVCRQCGHTQVWTQQDLLPEETEDPGKMAVFTDPRLDPTQPAYWEPVRDTIFTARELQAEIDEILDQPPATVDDMPARTYVLNTVTGTLHDRGMLSERCNTDQIPRSARKVSRDEAELKADPRYRRECGWCHPKVVDNPDA